MFFSLKAAATKGLEFYRREIVFSDHRLSHAFSVGEPDQIKTCLNVSPFSCHCGAMKQWLYSEKLKENRDLIIDVQGGEDNGGCIVLTVLRLPA